MDKEAFDLLLGPLEDILARNESKSGGKAPVAPPAGAMHGGRDPNKPKLLGKESMESGKGDAMVMHDDVYRISSEGVIDVVHILVSTCNIVFL